MSQWGRPTKARQAVNLMRWRLGHVLEDRLTRGWVRSNGSCGAAETVRLFLDSYLQLWELTGMPKKTEKRAEWVGFVDIKLTSEQDDAFDHWDLEDEDVLLLLGSTVAEGYKFTLAYNGSNDNFSASLTGGLATGENAGYTLSAFAETWYEAIKYLMFKHSVVCDGDWRNSPAATRAKRG